MVGKLVENAWDEKRGKKLKDFLNSESGIGVLVKIASMGTPQKGAKQTTQEQINPTTT